MRIVTGIAGLHRVVGHRVDHGESPRARRVEGMAHGTEFPVPGRRRRDVIRVLRVGFRGTVARFAGQITMISLLLFRDDLVMALRAGNRSGVPHRLGRLPFGRFRPLDPGVLEPRGNDELHDNDRRADHDGEDDQESHQGLGQLRKRRFHGRGYPP